MLITDKNIATEHTSTMQAYHLTLPRHIDASLQLPASKSLSARALILSVLAHNSHVSGLSQCDDTRVLLDALQHRPDEINIARLLRHRSAIAH